MGKFMKKVLWLTNIPSPYRVDFFNELGKSCELTVLFERRSSDERDKSWERFHVRNFNAIFLRGKKVGMAEAFCPEVIRFLTRGKYHHIIVTNYSDITGILAILVMRAKKIPYIIESDGGFPGSGVGIKEKLKKWLISGASQYFSTAKEHDLYYKAYGAQDKEIVRYPFTSLSETDYKNAVMLSRSDKKSYREKLGMEEKHILLSVGRFSYEAGYGKGYDILLQVGKKLGCDYGIYIVGDEPTEEFIKMKEDMNLPQIHYVGFKNKKDLADYYCAADCFVFLSRKEAWGLVVNEAMSYGIPIISSNNCIAATELVKDGENGFIIDLMDTELIAKRIRFIVGNEEIKSKFGEVSQRIIKNYTIEKMAETHILNLDLEGKE